MERTDKTSDVISSMSSVRNCANKKCDTEKRQTSEIIDTVEAFTETAQGANVSESNSCGNCEILEAQKKNLYIEYVELDAKRCVEIANLEKENRKLKMNAGIRKQHIQYLSTKVHRKEKSEASLKILLKDLKEQNILSPQAYEALEVC